MKKIRIHRISPRIMVKNYSRLPWGKYYIDACGCDYCMKYNGGKEGVGFMFWFFAITIV